MTTELQRPPGSPLLAGLEELQRSWGWFLALGLALIVLGALAIGASFIATLATVIVFGSLLLLGGGVEILSAFWARKWSGFFLHLLAGVLYVVVGLLMIEHPLRAAVGLTLMLAAIFCVGGLLRIILSVAQRFHNWGWMLLSGIVTLLLAILIWREWPLSGLWVIGLFVGIEMIFNGWSWVMLALVLRRIPQPKA